MSSRHQASVANRPVLTAGEERETEKRRGTSRTPSPSPSPSSSAGMASSSETDRDTTVAAAAATAATEKSLVRKLDRNLMPLVMVCYLMAFLDRANIGNAKTAGMNDALGLSDADYQWLLTIFYIPYIIFEWGTLMWKVVPPHIWAFFAILLWGLASTLQAVTTSWGGMMACRWFMATGQSFYSPGIPYLLSFFYKRRELGFRCGVYIAAAPLATTFSGALAYGITSGNVAIGNWRLLFIVEGLPTLVVAVLSFFFLPDTPDTAKFLTHEEKEVAKSRAIAQTGVEGTKRVGRIEFGQVLDAFKSPQTTIQALMYFSCNVSYASLPVFLPDIIEDMGFTSIHAQGLTAPPYLLAFLVCIFTTWLADRTSQRGLTIACLSAAGGTGYVLLAASHAVGARYLGVFLAAAGVFPCIANILCWSLNNQGTDTKRGVGIAVLNLVGQCGPILGTRLFPDREGPYYTTGFAVCAAFMFLNAALTMGLRAYFVCQNARFEALETSAAGSEDAPGAPARPGAEKAAAGAASGVEDGGEGPRRQAHETEMEGAVGYRYKL